MGCDEKLPVVPRQMIYQLYKWLHFRHGQAVPDPFPRHDGHRGRALGRHQDRDQHAEEGRHCLHPRHPLLHLQHREDTPRQGPASPH